MKVEKSCENCVNGKYIRGYMPTRKDLGFPDEIECQNNNVSSEVFEIDLNDNFYTYLPKVCGFYNPVIANKCCNCKTTINKPIIDVINVREVFSGELIPVCSEKCKEEYNNKTDEINLEFY